MNRLVCVKCNLWFDYPSRSSKYCSIDCAISSDDIREVRLITPEDAPRSYLVSRCVSVEMIRLLCRGMSNIHLSSTLSYALKNSFNLPNAKALIDEMYSLNYGTDLTDLLPHVVKAEISHYIIANCPNFDVNKASDHVVAMFMTRGIKADLNTLFRTTMYLIYAGARMDIFPPNFIDKMIETGYAQILSFVPNARMYPSAEPHLVRQQLIKQELIYIVPKDTEDIIVAYIGYDTPIQYRSYN